MVTRPAQPMPYAIRAALANGDVTSDFAERPAYQRNDYLRWIAQAKADDTRVGRVAQMPDELKRGGNYMGITRRPSAKA